LAAAAAALAWPVQAHDFWLQPRSFHLPAPGVAATSIQIGHGDAREAWAVKPERIVRFQAVGPAGAVDLRPGVRAGAADQPLPLRAPGLHVLVYESTPIPSVLPAQRFTDYLREEGLTPALQAREQTGRTQAQGREIYSRRAKALVQVGPAKGPQAHVTAPIGLTLEIVPERNPYALRPGEPLPVRVFYQGRPLPGALVKLTDLGRDEKPVEVRRTDAQGRALFRPRQDGEWLLNVVWTRPLVGDPRGDWDTVFSSLTFGYPRGGA
jgi:hypothetical protein